MAKAKKKIKTAARKAKKTVPKKKSNMKKATKPAAKKKAASAPRKKAAAKKSKSPAKAVTKKKKITAVPMTRMPETAPELHTNQPVENVAEKQQEPVQPNRREQNRKLERKFHEHQDMAMRTENEKVKSAMAKRQSMKPIFHGPR